MLEKTIEKAVVAWASSRGFLTPKMLSTENGWPDRLFISPYGHTIFIEFKRPGQYPTKLQCYRIEKLQERGIPAFWVDSEEAAIAILQTALEPETVPEKSNTTTAESGSGGAFSGSWLREDSDGPRYDKDSDAEETREAYTSNSPPTTSVQSLAGRDRKVGGISPPTVDGTPWDPEGG